MKISNDDLMTFLRSSRNAILELNGNDQYWQIDGIMYPEHRAFRLAEYCLLTGQPLTSIATVEGALNQARRITELERQFKALRREFDILVSYDLPKSQHWHWWRRSRG